MKSLFIFSPVALGSLLFLLSGCSEPEKTAEAVEEQPAPVEEVATVEEAVETVAEPKSTEVSLETNQDKFSYGVGYQFGTSIAQQPVGDLNLDAVFLGLKDGMSGAELKVSESELQAVFMEVQQRMAAEASAQSSVNLEAAEAFLDENKAREGVQVTDSGLQYEILTEGDGPKPAASDMVEVHYHGTLIDGTVFDSSVDRGETVKFPVQGVIPGWVEALQLMPTGSKWKLFIHPSLAYGERPTGSIPPNSALIFEVELIGIEAAPGGE